MAPYGRKHPRGSPEEAAVEDFAFFVELYVNARLPAWYYRLSAAARLVPLLKPEWDGTGTPPARPIAVGGIERRFCCGLLVEIHAADFADYLGPDQVAVGITASVEKLVFGIRALLERRPDFACWQIDLRNAFNQFQRALLPGRFAEAPPRLRRLLPFVCALLGPGAPLRPASDAHSQQRRVAVPAPAPALAPRQHQPGWRRDWHRHYLHRVGRVRVAVPNKAVPWDQPILYVVHAAHAVDTGPDTSRRSNGGHRADGRRSRDGSRGHHLHPRAAPPAAARRRRGLRPTSARGTPKAASTRAASPRRRKTKSVPRPGKQGIRHGVDGRHWRRRACRPTAARRTRP